MKRDEPKLKYSVIFFLVLIFIINFFVFNYTVDIRKPWFGILSPYHMQWLSGSAIKFAKNWYREGSLNLMFGMFENPKSIEFSTLQDRGFYSSYPPGTIIPIYFISRVIGNEPNPSLIMKYNLINHLLISFILSTTIFLLLINLNVKTYIAFLYSLIPAMFELLMPASLYWHQNVFFSDQAVILPFVIFVFLEVIRYYKVSSRISTLIRVAQLLVFFYGVLTDWFFLFVGLFVYLKRLMNKEIDKEPTKFIKESAIYWCPVITVIILFAIQLTLLKGWDRVIWIFLIRTALSNTGKTVIGDFFNVFWNFYITDGYGRPAVYLIWGSFIVFVGCLLYVLSIKFIWKKSIDTNAKKILSLISITLLPCLTQVYFFQNHSVVHDFSALKFSVPLSIIAFVLLPILFLFLFQLHNLHINLGLNINSISGTSTNLQRRFKIPIMVYLFIFVAILSGFYVVSEHKRYKDFFPNFDYEMVKASIFIGGNTGYEDIVFSPNFEISDTPPQKLSYSMKRVYKINSIFDVYDKIKDIEGDYIINIFLYDDNYNKKMLGIRELLSEGFYKSTLGTFVLCKINKDTFKSRYNKIQTNST